VPVGEIGSTLNRRRMRRMNQKPIQGNGIRIIRSVTRQLELKEYSFQSDCVSTVFKTNNSSPDPFSFKIRGTIKQF
jgi:hypothetical protein